MTKLDANRNLGWGKQALWQGIGGASADELDHRHSGLMVAYIGAAK